MWLFYAFGSALFAGITSILAKCGIKKTNSNVATAIRTVIVLLFSWIMVFLTGAQSGLSSLSGQALLFLVLSGLATGASWLCYFRALQLGDVNKVVPVDKSSIILTILLAFLLLHETVSAFKVAGLLGIAAGTYLMIWKTGNASSSFSGSDAMPGSGRSLCSRISSQKWLFYALLSAVFASLTSILAKIGITGIDSNLGTAIRTCVVLLMSWVIVFVTGKQHSLKEVPRSEFGFICLSGLATGASWLCYYRALQDGLASVVVPIDKLSILVTVAFSCLFLHEKLTKKAVVGLALITAGTLLMLL